MGTKQKGCRFCRRRSLSQLVEYATNDSDALFEGLEDLGDVTAEQVAVPGSKPQVATASASDAFESDDDLPF